jgi:hypothetical protein
MDINNNAQDESVEALIQKLHQKGTKVKIVKEDENTPLPQ